MRSQLRTPALTTAVFFFLALLVPASAMARPPRRSRTKTAAIGKVMVFCFIKGAEIQINGKRVGKAPMKAPLVLKPGNYTIRVFKRGYTEFVETVEVSAGKTRELEADLIAFAGILTIQANVEGATVAIDGKLAGKVPYDKDVPAGKHAVTVTAPGQQPFTQQVDLQAGKTLALNVQLTPIPEAPRVATGGGIATKWWFWTIIGVVVAGGATAAGVLAGGQSTTVTPEAAGSIQLP